MLQGLRELREECLYTPQHWGELRILLGLVSLRHFDLYAPDPEGLAPDSG